MHALVLNGSVGAGKTTIARAVGIQLEGRGIACAIVDLDSLVQCSNAPSDDPFNQRLMRCKSTCGFGPVEAVPAGVRLDLDVDGVGQRHQNVVLVRSDLVSHGAASYRAALYASTTGAGMRPRSLISCPFCLAYTRIRAA